MLLFPILCILFYSSSEWKYSLKLGKNRRSQRNSGTTGTIPKIDVLFIIVLLLYRLYIAISLCAFCIIITALVFVVVLVHIIGDKQLSLKCDYHNSEMCIYVDRANDPLF